MYYQYSPDAFWNYFERTLHSLITLLDLETKIHISAKLGKKSLKFSGVKQWNNLPSSLKEITEPKMFNKKFRKFIFG